MSVEASRRQVLEGLLALACFIIIVAGMRAASAILVPFLLAVFISVISTPFLVSMRRMGVPVAVAISLVLIGILIIGFLLMLLLGTTIADFTQSLPHYEERLREEIGGVFKLLEGRGIDVPTESLLDQLSPESAVQFFGSMLNSMGSVFSNAFLVMIIVFFILVEAAGFPQKFKRIMGESNETLRDTERILTNVRHYMALKTMFSALTGVVIAVWLTFLGVDYAILWGVMAFLFNFVPSIGSILAAIPATILAFIQLGLASSVYTAGGYLVVNVLIGNITEPRFMGHGLGLSPLVVFLSLLFWGWVLGPIGMLLSVPLTMTLKIALDSNDTTHWLGILLGPNVVKKEF